jgi:hypothetical protein
MGQMEMGKDKTIVEYVPNNVRFVVGWLWSFFFFMGATRPPLQLKNLEVVGVKYIGGNIGPTARIH